MKCMLILISLISTSAFAVPAPSPSPAESNGLDTVLTEDFIHALRDPFKAPLLLAAKVDKPKTDLENYQLKEFKLNGILASPKRVRAMITAPNGKGFFVAVGDKIGQREGHVTAILNDAVKVVEYEIDEKGKKVPEILEIRMNGELVSLTKKEE